MTYPAKRILGYGGETCGYEYRNTIIEKEYYADGPSLYVWMIYGFGPDGVSEHNRLKDAKRYIDHVKDET